MTLKFSLQKYWSPVLLFAGASLLMGLYAGFYDPSFNNYLAQVHQISEVARGGLEFPRELPGFLTVFIFTLLIFLPDTRIAMLAAMMVCVSLLGQGFLAPNLTMVVVWMLLWSTGAHLFMVLKNSICLRLASKGHAGRLLGRIGALEAFGTLLGMLFIYEIFTHLKPSFSTIFLIAGCCALAAGVLLALIKPVPLQRPEHNFVLKRRYSLYYLLNVLYGARKQVFLTFAPWVLITLFHCNVETFAMLGLIGTSLSLVFRPLLGVAIDRWGERIVIFAESTMLVIICVLYGFSPLWFSAPTALIIIMACYIADQLLFAVHISRATYLNRIAECQSDVAPTLSMGQTIDHAVSMMVPMAGGLVWAHFGVQWVFAGAATIALLNLAAACFIPPLPQSRPAPAVETVN
ncbi:MAG TPA: MFS transporter [Syntrophomonadaceae bacterium]|nr:MFS transporter [Syntrophomonadaceae bacterium]